MTTDRKVRVAIARVLDASGSMQAVRGATVSGMNEWLADQQRDDDTEALVLDVQFNSRVRIPHDVMNVKEVQPLDGENYRCVGWTALNDAVGAAIDRLTTYDADRYLVLIVTDGQENKSVTFSAQQIKAKITALEATGKWSFLYLGAHVDAWLAAEQYGVQAGNTARTVSSDHADAPRRFVGVLREVSASTRMLRSDARRGVISHAYFTNVQALAPDLNSLEDHPDKGDIPDGHT